MVISKVSEINHLKKGGRLSRRSKPVMYLNDRAYSRIKEWIVRYHLKPGTYLPLDELAAALDMSQTPIREALNRLEREKLVIRRPKKGYVVRTMTLREVEDIYDLRIAVEVLGAKQAALRHDARTLVRMHEVVGQVERLLAESERCHPVDEERSFHELILSAGGNQLLSDTGRSILDRIWMIQSLSLLSSERLVAAHHQHRDILEAVEEKRADLAGSLMMDHLTAAKAFVLDRMKDRNDLLSTVIAGLPDLEMDRLPTPGEPTS
jgi:DNA-binding GntR family transcriptional regulator